MEQDNHIEFDAELAAKLGFDAETAAQFGITVEEALAAVAEKDASESIESGSVECASGVTQESSGQIKSDDVVEESIIEEDESREIVVCESEDVMDKIKEYISNDSCNIVFAVTDKLIRMAEEDEELADDLRKADMLISNLDLKKEETESEEQEEGIDVHLITQIAEDEEIERLSLMLMTEEQELAEQFENRMHDLFEENDYLEFEGSYVVAEGTEDDLILNEINASLPDVLVCACKTPHQEKWLLDNRTKMCAKLVIALSGEKEEFLQKKDDGVGLITRIFGRR